MKYIYARVSTKVQSLQSQLQLQEHYPDAELVVSEKVSGMTSVDERTEFSKLNEKLTTGDSVIVCDLSRLGRNARPIAYQIIGFRH
ncbi:recombinase family protein [Vibrio sp. F13]|uniref:recombinase family protein n=1 Tax=Vibrio sp. F13 TaxID=2070777 RepID=UPI001F0FFD90|nr:recombinase family protein [Vibrio sp. F13]